ncbi:hypothetical protein PCANC_26528, partial [Puccinia coronata f. sp. avenae]
MAVVRNPNHPMLVNGLFQSLSQSVSSAPHGNMYGVLQTPSYVQCSGLTGTGNNDFEIQLSTNNVLNNKLEDGSTYMLNGRMIALSDGTPPVVTYSDTSVVKVIDKPAPPPDMINKTYVIGLGHVSHQGEVISHEPERSILLEVTVAHNDWDPVVGREVQIVGSLIDFESNTNFPVVFVSSVSVTSRHKTARGLTASGSGATPSPQTGRN